MRIRLLTVAVLLALSLAAPARAQSTQDGTVFQLRIRSTDGLAYVYLAGPRTAT